jgi:hypothetical protein
MTVVGVPLGRFLLVVHAIVGGLAVATTTHLVVWSYPSLSRRPTRTRGIRTFALWAMVSYIAQLVLGNVLYPAYKVRVRMGYLEERSAAGQNLGWVSRVFDWKEHWVAIGLPLLVVAFVLSGRRAPSTAPLEWPRAVFFCALGAAVCAWTAAIIGLLVTSVRSVGAS